MSKVKVGAFSVSLDGFGAGPRQDLNNPLGVRGFELHAWFQKTAVFHKMHHLGDGSQGVDNDFAARSFDNVGAWILGRNMFGPVRGPWKDDSWKGWWGDEPPYHVPVFVLTHHARAITHERRHHVSLCSRRARIRIKASQRCGPVVETCGGGVSTIRQYLTAGHVDEMHLAFSPVVLGEGENLFADIHLPKLGFRPVQTTAGEDTTHVIFKRA
jgi:dihydrofolate reductase